MTVPARTARRRAAASPEEAPPAQPPVETNGRGRPTKYGQHMVDAVQAMVDQGEGATYTQIAIRLKIDRGTLKIWMEDNPDFSSVVNQCRNLLVGDFEGAMRDNARHGGGNATAGIFMLKNLAPDEYRDRREHVVEHTGVVELDFLGYDEDALDAIEGEYEELEE